MSDGNITGRVSHIQRFSTGDGPGIRTTVFFQGCNLRCGWCHNPETISASPILLHYPGLCIGCGSCVRICPTGAQSIVNGSRVFSRAQCIACGKCAAACPTDALTFSGKIMTAEEVIKTVLEDLDFYDPDGGVTLSGGEPLLQPAFALALLRGCTEKGIGTIVDTALCVNFSVIEKIVPYTTEFYVDIKCATEADYGKYIGGSLENVLTNCSNLQKSGGRIRLRIPIIPGINDANGYFLPVAERLYNSGARNVDLLPFHRLGAGKYDAMEMSYAFRDAVTPDAQKLDSLRSEWESYGFIVNIDGFGA